MEGLASGANEVHFCSLFYGNRIIYGQKELPAFLTKFFQGVMLNITLRANDHFGLRKSSFREPLGGLMMHFVCHRINKFLSSDFNVFSHCSKKEFEKIAGYGQKLSISSIG
jgi:hypothetical protein